jgi:beta-lactamase regulating signal transducer with metallopeptidase domain
METIFNLMTDLSHNWVMVAVHGLWFGAAMGALVWLVRRYAKSINAATGYIVWWAVLALVIGGPVLMMSAPFEVDAPVLSERSAKHDIHVSEKLDRSNKTYETYDVASLSSPEGETDAQPKSTWIEAQPAAVGQQSTEEGTDWLLLLARLLPVVLFAAWVFTSLVLLLRVAWAYRSIVRIKMVSVPFDVRHFPRVDGLLRRAAIRRRIRLHLTSDIDSPVAAGLGNPTILLPAKLADHLSERELEAVVIHEIAHLRRRDDWAKLIQRVIESILFFNPAVRWIGRQLDLDREIACDDRVVELVGKPNEYARCLTRLTQLATMPEASLIPGVLTGRKQIFRRFEELLNGNRRHGVRFCGARCFAAIVVVAAAAVLAIHSVPTVALPVDAVTFEELSETVAAITARDARGAENAEPILASSDEAFDASMYFAVSNEPPTETTPTGTADRVVDWDDAIFDLPITGTIHGDNDDDAIRVWISDDQTIRAAMQGQIRFSSHNNAIKKISRGGYLAIKEEQGSERVEVDVTRGDDGGVAYAYFVDGKPAEFDADGQRWLAQVVGEMVGDLSQVTATPAPRVPHASVAVAVESDPAPDVQPMPGTVTPLPADAAVAPSIPSAGPGPEAPRAVAVSYSSKPSTLSRIIDWASNPFNMDGKGLMVSTEDDGEMSILWSDGHNKLKVKLDGEVEFSEDDRSIESISRDGYLAIEEKRGSDRREIYVEPNEDGELEYDYYVDRKRREFDDEAENWLAGVLIDVIRNTGIGAESRSRRILERGGVDALLKEINQIESDYVQRVYYSAALDMNDLTNDGYSRILASVKRNVDSDYEKAEILVDMADRVSEDPALIEAYVDVVATIDSDYETRRALSAVSIGSDVDDDVIDAVLEIAAQMDSDYEKAELLIEMAPRCRESGQLQNNYVDAVVDIDSDYEARRVLSALSLSGDVPDNVLQTVLGVASRFDSDYEMAELLIDMVPYIAQRPGSQDTYLGAVSRIDSDYEAKRTLTEFIDVAEMTDNRILAILRVVEGMGSSYEQSEVLKDLAKYCRGNEPMEDAFINTVETLDSDYEIDQLYRTLYRRDRQSSR